MLIQIPLQMVAPLLDNAMRERFFKTTNCADYGSPNREAAVTRSVFRRWLACAVCLLALSLCVGTGGVLAAQETGGTATDVPVTTQQTNAEKPTPRLRAAAIPHSPLEIAQSMGLFFLGAFLLASVVALWFGIERLVVLRRGRVIPRPFVERFLNHLEENKLIPADALKLCEDNGSPVAAVFAHGIRKWGKSSVEVEQAIIDGGERQVSQLKKHLRVLNGVATVTPLLGLLGTVIGMIEAFNQIASAGAMGKADQLAVGIAMALLTTAAGLMIAIPSLILYLYLSGRVDALVMDMDLLAQNVVNLISAEAIADKPLRASRSRGQHTPADAAPAKPKNRKAV